jgi:hypothetical protein
MASAGGHLWAATVGSPSELRVDRVQRVTFGPGNASQPATGPDGLVAFVGSTSAQNVWALPLDSEKGVVRGEPRQVTLGAGPNARASHSDDRRMMAYQAYRGNWTILIRETGTARTVDLAVAAQPFGPVLSPDGTRVAYPDATDGVSLVSTRGGEATPICPNCEPGEWTPDGRSIAFTDLSRGTAQLHLFDVGTGDSRLLVEAGEGTNRAHISRDGRWLAFRVTARGGGRGSEVFVAPLGPDLPAPRSAWISVSDVRERDARPTGWSPRGNMIYILSSRDGFRCLYGRPWDAKSGRPAGPLKIVRHFHNFRNPGGGGASVISTGAGSAIAGDEFIFDYSTTNGDVWTLRLAPKQ